MEKPSDRDMLEIRSYIDTVEWRFARTMSLCPHFYNVLSWNPEKRAGFFKLVTAIFNYGYKEEWPPPSEEGNMGSYKKRIVTYFNVDDYNYWVMDPTIEETDLINRAKIS